MPNNTLSIFLLGTTVKYQPITVDKVSKLEDKENGSDYGIAETLSLLASLIDNNDNMVSLPFPKEVFQQHILNKNVIVIEGVDGPGAKVYSRIATAVAIILDAVDKGITDITLHGFSRGAVEALLVAHELNRIKNLYDANPDPKLFNQTLRDEIVNSLCTGGTREELILKLEHIRPKMNLPGFRQNLAKLNIAVYNIDPVPGTMPLMGWKDDRFTQVPEIVSDYQQVLYKHEISEAFQVIIPSPAAGKKYQMTALPGQHASGSGNFRAQNKQAVPPRLGVTHHVQELVVLNQLLFMKEHGISINGTIDPRFDSLMPCFLKVQYGPSDPRNKLNAEINQNAKVKTSGYILTLENKNPPKLEYYDHLTKNTVPIAYLAERVSELTDLFILPYKEDATQVDLKLIEDLTKHRRSQSHLIPMIRAFIANQNDPEHNAFDIDAQYLRIYDSIVENNTAYEYFRNTPYTIKVGPVRQVFQKNINNTVLLSEVLPNYSNHLFLNEHHAELKVKQLLQLDSKMPLPELIKTIVANLIKNTAVDTKTNHKLQEIIAAKEMQVLIEMALSTIINQVSQGYLDDSVVNSAYSKQLYESVVFAFTSLSASKSGLCQSIYKRLRSELAATVDKKCTLLTTAAEAILAGQVIEKPNPTNHNSPLEAIDPLEERVDTMVTALEIHNKIEKFKTDLDKFSDSDLFTAQADTEKRKLQLSELQQKLFAKIEADNPKLEEQSNSLLSSVQIEYKSSFYKSIKVPSDEKSSDANSDPNRAATPIAKFKNLVWTMKALKHWQSILVQDQQNQAGPSNLNTAAANESEAVPTQYNSLNTQAEAEPAVPKVSAAKYVNLWKSKNKKPGSDSSKDHGSEANENRADPIPEQVQPDCTDAAVVPVDDLDSSQTLANQAVVQTDTVAATPAQTVDLQPPAALDQREDVSDKESAPTEDLAPIMPEEKDHDAVDAKMADNNSKDTPDSESDSKDSEESPDANPVEIEQSPIINKLLAESDKYLKYLRNESKKIDASFNLDDTLDSVNVNLVAIKNKYSKVNGLKALLNDNKTPLASARIEAFKTQLTTSTRGVLATHRNPDWMWYAKSCCFVLGALITGILPFLLFTYARNKSPLFFTQTEGEQYSDKALKISGLVR